MRKKKSDNLPYPLLVDAEKKYYWCDCGLSETQPLCNGSHASDTAQPIEFSEMQSKTVYLCGCKHTKTPPYCDGSHADL